MRFLLLSTAVLATFAFPTSARAQLVQPPPGFVAVFNGRDLSGWHGWAIHDRGMSPQALAALNDKEQAQKIAAWTEDAKKHWSVQNGELVNDGHGAYLTTDKEFGDMELLIEYKTVPKADSGIYLRATPQVQIWDHTDERQFRNGADKGSGALWNNSAGAPGKDPMTLADKPFGEWNKFRITQVGERTTIYLNDKLVVNHARMENYWGKQQRPADPKAPLPRTGPILLQTHGGEIRWRNIFVREIPPSEANTILASHGGEGFADLFNGKTLDGWAGAVNNYEVKDGAILCKPGRGGVLHTTEQFAGFVARIDFKLPPGGNNGLAIRYPGQGDTSVTGMCELQILDDGHSRYARLDPRQAHGSAYGMIPARRGYLRPAGQWNFQEVTVKGTTIKVELNGTLILDGDLSKVTEFMDNKAHPGKDRTSGSFGFAGHSDPVAFRSVRIKPIK